MSKRCDWCNKEHKRKRFCSNKCKDKYHNHNNPRGKFAHLKDKTDWEIYEDEVHPLSEDGLGQS